MPFTSGRLALHRKRNNVQNYNVHYIVAKIATFHEMIVLFVANSLSKKLKTKKLVNYPNWDKSTYPNWDNLSQLGYFIPIGVIPNLFTSSDCFPWQICSKIMQNSQNHPFNPPPPYFWFRNTYCLGCFFPKPYKRGLLFCQNGYGNKYRLINTIT